MKKIHRIAVVLLCCIALMTGCAKPTEVPVSPTENATAAPTAAPTEAPQRGGESLDAVRREMEGTSQVFAVAYFGYHETLDSEEPVDPFAVMQSYTPELCAKYPFLLEIPKERIVGEAGDLFCIVPLDPHAKVAVSKGSWNEQSEQYLYEDSLYFSKQGEPILLFCNTAGFEPDTQLCVSGESGDAVWYPRIDLNRCVSPLRSEDWEDLHYDFSAYREMLAADYHSMQGNPDWEMVLPAEEDLIGKTWVWHGYSEEGTETSYAVTFNGGYLTVRWNDGYDKVEHIYENAEWTLAHEQGYAVLTIDFGEFAGICRYDLLYNPYYEDLYVAMDVLQEEMNIGWEPLYRNMMLPLAPDPVEMAGSWELAWKEIEGYREEAEPGSNQITITTDYAGLYQITCSDYAFPEDGFADKELVIFPEELYYGCGNDQWVAAVNYTGPFGTEYHLTLLYNDTLLLQRYWVVDGAPMVSYGCYRRMN